MKNLNEKTYASSSAAYRAIRHYEAKNGKTNLTCSKIEKGVFKIIENTENAPENTEKNTKLFEQEFKEIKPNVKYDTKTYRFFPDGIHGPGYYELKTGERRRPNSKFMELDNVISEITREIPQMVLSV